MDELFERSGAKLKNIIPGLYKVITVLTIVGAIGAFFVMVSYEMNGFLALLIAAVSAAAEIAVSYFVLLNLHAAAEQSDNTYELLARMEKKKDAPAGDTWKKVQTAVKAEQAKPVPPQQSTVAVTVNGDALKCPKCGTEQRSYRQTCFHCGVRFDKTVATDSADQGPVAVTVEGETLVCPACGTEQRSDRRVCFHCGVQFDKTPNP